ncbi:hypothetical protein N7471_001914 [Penicillium samsonianum]|uniref:uncharacterized protein n=1 Tax=Penicillium samsonianum TaxID=1882272 RepID=UPI00254677AC|nr:uncharacterized protein N7471_001914 [Penicillium samsonianum]KAJ6142461.1 hypothetical protein N7471_001914 [Penicillium samsonianum]
MSIKCSPPEGVSYTNIRGEPSMVTVQDLRGKESSVNLDHDSIHIVQGQILANVPGATKVHIFRHGIRYTNNFPVPYNPPALIAHLDHTGAAVVDRVRYHLHEEEAEKLLQGHYRVIHFWQCLNGTVYTCPLAIASSATVKDKDIVTMVSHLKDLSEDFGAPINRDHQKWYYLFRVGADEAIMLQIFDSYGSKPGSGVKGGRAVHVAFKDPRTPPNAPYRWSIETSALVFGPWVLFSPIRKDNFSGENKIKTRRVPVHYVSTSGIANFTRSSTFAEVSAASVLPPTDGSQLHLSSK